MQKLSSEEEISEEEQIRRATELSLQECHMPPPAAYDFDAMPVCQLERTEEDDRKLRENALVRAWKRWLLILIMCHSLILMWKISNWLWGS